MATGNPLSRMEKHWRALYGETGMHLLEEFARELTALADRLKEKAPPPEWYKDAIVYSLYVDLFSDDLKGLEKRLGYLEELGVNCLWLLPVLDSPMRDAGFDISDYRRIRPDLLGLEKGFPEKKQKQIFGGFIQKAHAKGIRVIFDIALNHTSDQHEWFREARKSKDNRYRDHYIWSDTADRYADARIIFDGIEDSNWKKEGEEYFFHRFFDFQPDLNYRNPEVLIEMSKNLLYWLDYHVDGFRVDAIPYLWKEEGTDCENLPQTHSIVKFIRAVIDHVRPNTLLLAEACQKPAEVVRYFGDGDECHAGYHFPLMPQMFKAVAKHSRRPVEHTLSPEVTPEIPDECQWFTFLRLHDELSLESVYVTEEDRKFIHENYCHDPSWDFRLGEGISARLSELMQRDAHRIGLIYSVMLTLPGTPVVYYGDEFGKLNDKEYYREMIRQTGKDDTRFLVRGRVEWDKLMSDLDNEGFHADVYDRISRMIQVRKQFKCFGRGTIEWLDPRDPSGQPLEGVLMYTRKYGEEEVMVVQNLSGHERMIRWPYSLGPAESSDLLDNEPVRIMGNGAFTIPARGYFWLDRGNL